jgi:hypothetical protein
VWTNLKQVKLWWRFLDDDVSVHHTRTILNGIKFHSNCDWRTTFKFILGQGTYPYAYGFCGSSFGICDDSLNFTGRKAYTVQINGLLCLLFHMLTLNSLCVRKWLVSLWLRCLGRRAYLEEKTVMKVNIMDGTRSKGSTTESTADTKIKIFSDK